MKIMQRKSKHSENSQDMPCMSDIVIGTFYLMLKTWEVLAESSQSEASDQYVMRLTVI